MTDKEFDKAMEFMPENGILVPNDEGASGFVESCAFRVPILLKDVGGRDAKYHKCYMMLLNYIYDLLPDKFYRVVPQKKTFYKWLKRYQGKYNVEGTFLDHERVSAIKEDLNRFCLREDVIDGIALKYGRVEIVEYVSISFSRMTEKQFRGYVRSQLPFIYENVIGMFYEGTAYDNIITQIENEFEKFLGKY